MAKAKKSKRDDRVVLYVRVKPQVHAKIVKIAEHRGHPHTRTSVAAEMIERSLETEGTVRQ